MWRGTHLAKGPKIAQAMSSSASSKMIWAVRGIQDEANAAGGFARLQDPVSTVDKDRWRRHVNAQGGKNGGMTTTDEISLEEMNASHWGIRVKNEITIVSEAWDYKDRLY